MTQETGPLELEFFTRNGFMRKKCTSCGSYFWTLDAGRERCGDPPCSEYEFIGNPPTKYRYTVDEMRDAFINFFSSTHKVLKPYPIVPRWRDDVLLVNASIYDFQPHVTSGRVEPPGNPIVMSQPCVRMNDVESVGATGRHLTSFEMMCHDAFNRPGRYVYWRSETVEYCHRFLTEVLGIDGKIITYKEKPWSGGGNAGAAVEVFVRGLEVATLVFMDLREDPNGDIEIEGTRYSHMEMNIVDTGYGLERLAWLSQGTPTVYHALYGDVVDAILEASGKRRLGDEYLEKIVKHLAGRDEYGTSSVREALGSDATEENLHLYKYTKDAFIVADHARTLFFMFSDYVIPSNTKVGYLARLLIRRSLRALEELGCKLQLFDIVKMQAMKFSTIVANFPEGFVRVVLEREAERYRETVRSGTNEVRRLISRGKGIGQEDLITLYDSHGIPPELVQAIAEENGVKVTVPENFTLMVLKRHEVKPRVEKRREDYPDIKTRPLYYDDGSIRDFNALVLFSRGNEIITNQTAFYPEGGGQPCDTGYFTYGGRNIRVMHVKKVGDAIVHVLEEPIPERARIMGHVDGERRWYLSVHHSATHLLLGVLRKVLGEHVWQSGVQKNVESSRLDITHYSKITEEEIRRIEKECMRVIAEDRKIIVTNMEWNRALSKYGFRLFEGGIPEGPKIRVVEIEDLDAEGCGGTHLSSTGQIGMVKIIGTETIQEGVQRLTFVAGPAALDHFQKEHAEMERIRLELKPQGSVSEAVSRLLGEKIGLEKEVESLASAVAERYLEGMDGGGFRVIEVPNIPVLLKKIPTVVNSRKVPGVIMLYRDGREYRVVCTSSTLSCAGVLQVEGLKVLREGQRYAEAVSQEYPEKLISKFNAK